MEEQQAAQVAEQAAQQAAERAVLRVAQWAAQQVVHEAAMVAHGEDKLVMADEEEGAIDVMARDENKLTKKEIFQQEGAWIWPLCILLRASFVICPLLLLLQTFGSHLYV